MRTILDKTIRYATKCHNDRNHMYGDKPYTFHLNMVADTAEQFKYYIPEDDQPIVFSACWGHDLIEDTGVTFNDVKNALNEEVANIVFALSNEKGKTRKDRANKKYYRGIREVKYGVFVKFCDRIANITNGLNNNSKMVKMYEKEHNSFIKSLTPPIDRFLNLFRSTPKYPYPNMISQMEFIYKTYNNKNS